MTFQELVSLYNIKPEHIDALTGYVIEVAAGSRKKPGRPKAKADESDSEQKAKRIPFNEIGICNMTISENKGFCESLDGSALITFHCDSFRHSARMNYMDFASLIFDGIEVFNGQVSTLNAVVKPASSLRMDVLEPMLRNLFLGTQLKYAVQVKRAIADELCPTEIKSLSVVGFANPGQTEFIQGVQNGTTQIHSYS